MKIGDYCPPMHAYTRISIYKNDMHNCMIFKILITCKIVNIYNTLNWYCDCFASKLYIEGVFATFYC